MPKVRRPVTHRLLEEVQAEDEQHAEALLTLLINTSRFPAASDGAAPRRLRSPHRGYKL